MPDEKQSQNTFEKSPEELKHELELINPRFDLVADHFKCTIPFALQALYSNHEKLLKSKFFIDAQHDGASTEFYVESYDAINQYSILVTDSHNDLLSFATCIGEVCYVIDPRSEDPEVSLFVLDAHRLEPSGFTLTQFINAPCRYKSKIV